MHSNLMGACPAWCRPSQNPHSFFPGPSNIHGPERDQSVLEASTHQLWGRHYMEHPLFGAKETRGKLGQAHGKRRSNSWDPRSSLCWCAIWIASSHFQIVWILHSTFHIPSFHDHLQHHWWPRGKRVTRHHPHLRWHHRTADIMIMAWCSNVYNLALAELAHNRPDAFTLWFILLGASYNCSRCMQSGCQERSVEQAFSVLI